MTRDISHWANWSDDELIDQAAGAAQSLLLLEDGIIREAIALNVIAPLRQAIAKLTASAIEAQRATTTEIGVVEDESAMAKPDAQTPTNRSKP